MCHFSLMESTKHTQAHIGAYVRTLFVKVFHNCSNSLRRIQVRVHIFVFRTRPADFFSLFSYFCLYIVRLPSMSTCLCVCLFCIVHSSMSAAFVVISPNSFTTKIWRTRWRWLVSRGSNHMHTHSYAHIAYILQNFNSMLKIVAILKLEMKQSLLQKLF